MIEALQVGKSYADGCDSPYWALRDVSFKVNDREVVGLVGANGAGKTSLLRILSTVLRPSSGSATVSGFDVVTQPELVRGQIGFVSANTAVYDRMTGMEYVRFFGRFYSLTNEVIESRMATLFDRFRMNDLRDLLCGRMSTGMKQKISIARALIHNPHVLIFDEATLGLDIVAARNVMDMVVALRDEGKCIVFSTHNMSEIERVCDRIVVLHRGHLVAVGSPAELLSEFGQARLEDVFFRIIDPEPQGVAT